MNEPQTKVETHVVPGPVSMVEFLETVPPSQMTLVQDLVNEKWVPGGGDNLLCTPPIQSHCSHARCKGIRIFRLKESESPIHLWREIKFCYLPYVCSNCTEETKTFSLAVQMMKE